MSVGRPWSWLSLYGRLFDERAYGFRFGLRDDGHHLLDIHAEGVTMAVYLYGRVSTDDQALSADNQRQMLLDHAARHGIVPAGVFIDDDVSGGTPIRRRPEGSKMFDALRPGDKVVLSKLDRGFRNVIDALVTMRDCNEYGIEWQFLDMNIDTSTIVGQMMIANMAMYAEMERKQIGARVKDAWQYLKRNGKPYATARPWGWTRKGKGINGEWVPCEKERAVAQRVIDMRQDGMTWERIALKLCLAGVEKPTNRPKSRPMYYASDVRALALAAADGFPTDRPARRPARGRGSLPLSQEGHAPLPGLLRSSPQQTAG